MMGTVTALGWKMYDWAVLTGESQPLQNSLARITLVPSMSMWSSYSALVAVGSLPSSV